METEGERWVCYRGWNRSFSEPLAASITPEGGSSLAQVSGGTRALTHSVTSGFSLQTASSSVIHDKMALVVPSSLAEAVQVALPNMPTDHLLHGVGTHPMLGILVPWDEMRLGLDQHPEGAVVLFDRADGGGGLFAA